MTDIDPVPPLAELRGVEGGTFTVFREGGDDAELRLRSVDVRRDGREEWEQFALRFDPVGETHVEQDLYRVYNEDLGEFDVTVSPSVTADPDPDDVDYEAVVNRHVPDREPAGTSGADVSRRGILASLLGVALGSTVLDSFLGGGSGEGTARAATAGASVAGTSPLLGTIGMFGFDFAPRDWATCDGQLMAISQNTALFSLLGNQYGGDGRTTFGIPDLRGRFPMHQGNRDGIGYPPGDTGGSRTVSLSESELPVHGHGQDLSVPVSTSEGNAVNPDGNAPAAQPDARGTDPVYTDESTDGSMAVAGDVSETGGGRGHQNMPPYQVINYCVALYGTYPSRD